LSQEFHPHTIYLNHLPCVLRPDKMLLISEESAFKTVI